jgi:hypothetical protein
MSGEPAFPVEKISRIPPDLTSMISYSFLKPTQILSPHHSNALAGSGTASSFTSTNCLPSHSKTTNLRLVAKHSRMCVGDLSIDNSSQFLLLGNVE